MVLLLIKENRAFMPTSGSIISFGQITSIFMQINLLLQILLELAHIKSFSENVVGSGKIYFQL